MSEALADFQARFTRALRGVGDPGFSAGLTVYRNTVAKAWRDALAANFPSVRSAMGEAAFNACARDYTSRLSRTHAELCAFGEDFSDFLSREAAHRPDWATLAALDRAFTEAHLAEDVETLSASTLAAVEGHALAQMRLALHPSVRMLTGAPDVLAAWLRLRFPRMAPIDQMAAILLARRGGGVDALPLNAAGLAFVSALRRRASLADAAEAACAHIAIAPLLARLISAGAFLISTEVITP